MKITNTSVNADIADMCSALNNTTRAITCTSLSFFIFVLNRKFGSDVIFGQQSTFFLSAGLLTNYIATSDSTTFSLLHRPSCHSSLFQAWETFLQEIEADSVSANDVSRSLSKQVNFNLTLRSRYCVNNIFHALRVGV